MFVKVTLATERTVHSEKRTYRGKQKIINTDLILYIDPEYKEKRPVYQSDSDFELSETVISLIKFKNGEEFEIIGKADITSDGNIEITIK